MDPQYTPKPITQAEADEALDRREFDRLVARYGHDTILSWWTTSALRDVRPGMIGDPRR